MLAICGVCARIACAAAQAQTPPTLTLQQAEALAVQNHPQIQAAQHEVNYANQQIVDQPLRLLSGRDRRCDRLARQRSVANRRRGPVGFPLV